MLEDVKHLIILAASVIIGAATLGAVTLGDVMLSIGLLDFLGSSLLV